MGDNSSTVTKSDGTQNFSGGVNSLKCRTLQSNQNPDGLPRNVLAWLNNATVRDGGITPRAGWQPLGQIHDATGLYQGGWMYDPITAENPYLVLSISGRIYRVNIDPVFSVQDLSATFSLTNPPLEPFGHATQGFEFMVWQAGDNVTLPLFWDGTTLRRSNGITGFTGTIPPVSPLPPTVHLLTIGAFTVPIVGNTVLVTLAAPYPGSLGDTGTLGAIGTYEVTAIGASDFTIETISSGFVGSSIAATANVPFTIPAPPPIVVPDGPINEIPAATCMDYYMGRIWYAQGTTYAAGDIVHGPSGTLPYQFRDSILKVTENPLAVGGDNFAVPTNSGNIRFLRNNATIDTATGEGRLLIGTRKNIYSLVVPVSRADWIAADDNNQPLQTVVQIVNGAVNDRCVVPINGDLYFQSIDPGIRSLANTLRLFNQPGNISISANEQRLIQFNDRSLMSLGASGIEFNNRLLQSQLPRQLPQGVVSDAIAPLDFVPISSVGEQRPPVWEGMYEGLQILQLFRGDFGGLERAFAVVVSSIDGSINLWELTQADKFQDGDNRVTFLIETPSWTWSRHSWELDLKKLVSLRLWIDRIFGTVEFDVKYRPDSSTCWQDWARWKECTARNSAEDVNNPVTYPLTGYGECYATRDLPKPPESCAPCGTGRPAYIGYQFEIQLTIKGFCRVRGIWPVAERRDEKLYENLIPC